jgi:hypothetical protein
MKGYRVLTGDYIIDIGNALTTGYHNRIFLVLLARRLNEVFPSKPTIDDSVYKFLASYYHQDAKYYFDQLIRNDENTYKCTLPFTIESFWKDTVSEYNVLMSIDTDIISALSI